nr:hypothetical protein CFP56_59391 [Quercus suber]
MSLLMDSRVSVLIDEESHIWNAELIQTKFMDHEARLILESSGSSSHSLGQGRRWIPPILPYCKVNFNKALFSSEGTTGLEIVIRDSSGNALHALAQRIIKPTSTAVVEALACRRAMFFAKEKGVLDCIFEGDAEVIIQAIRSSDFSHPERLKTTEEVVTAPPAPKPTKDEAAKEAEEIVAKVSEAIVAPKPEPEAPAKVETKKVQFIEEEEEGALKRIEDISVMAIERKKKPKNAKISRWPERTVLCFLCFVGHMSEQYTIHSEKFVKWISFNGQIDLMEITGSEGVSAPPKP